jgi:hypothetical protein
VAGHPKPDSLANQQLRLAVSIFIYKLTVDAGVAPCVEKGILSLAICKPMIRMRARPGDLIFGFAANRIENDNRGLNQLIYVARVTGKEEEGAYYSNSRYSGRKDRIYRQVNGKFVRRAGGDRFHTEATDLLHDLGEPPGYSRAAVLLSNDFRYYGRYATNKYQKFSAIKKAVERLKQGHRARFSEEEQRQLLTLKNELWNEPRRRHQPTSEPRASSCFRD